MKYVFVLFVIGIFGLSIFAVESNVTSLLLMNEDIQNTTNALKMKVVQIISRKIESDSSLYDIINICAKAEEDALNEVCQSSF